MYNDYAADWHLIGELEAFALKGLTEACAAGNDLVIVRTDENLFAFHNDDHNGVRLSSGQLVDNQLIVGQPLRFDIETGLCEQRNMMAALRIVAVMQVDDEVYVHFGD